MIPEQKPIGSGFGPESTASDVLQGIDLTGKLAVVTGGHSGIGSRVARALTDAGATVVVPALDLADQLSIHDFAREFLAQGRAVDILINHAAVRAGALCRVGPGWESQFGVNHLGPFALTNLLWPALADGGARVVTMSAPEHTLSGIRWDDLHWERSYDAGQAYGQARTANVLFAVELDRLGRDDDVRAFAVSETGGVSETAGATSVWAATSPLLAGLGGVWCADCDIAEAGAVASHAVDLQEAATLWAVSAGLTGVDAFTRPL